MEGEDEDTDAANNTLETDPIKKDMKAFALDKTGKNEVDEAGFAIIDFRD